MGRPKRTNKIYGDVKDGKDSVNYEQLYDIVRQQAKYIKRMGKINNK
jgi:hypothetical protein